MEGHRDCREHRAAQHRMNSELVRSQVMKDLGSHLTEVEFDSSWKERHLDGLRVKERRREPEETHTHTKYQVS